MLPRPIACTGCTITSLGALRSERGGIVDCPLRPMRFAERRRVVQEGDEATNVYLVRSGMVRTFQTLAPGGSGAFSRRSTSFRKRFS